MIRRAVLATTDIITTFATQLQKSYPRATGFTQAAVV